jgi:hypothetical protein
LREAVSGYVAAFDPAVVSGDDASVVMREAKAIESAAGALKALAAARVAETAAWKRSGDRSAAHHLARTTGTTVSAAAETLSTAQRMRELPELDAAARRGDLSAQQAAAISGAAGANPSATRRLLEAAERQSLQELRDECARTKAASESVGTEERRRRMHRRRYLRTFTDDEGGWNLRFRDNPEVGAEILSALEPLRDRIFERARKEGRRENFEAYGADALVAMARRSESCECDGGEACDDTAKADCGGGGHADADVSKAPKSASNSGDPPAKGPRRKPKRGQGRRRRFGRAKVIVRVDAAALRRGRPTDGEVVEVVGVGPVAVSAVREILAEGDPFLAAVVTDGVTVTGVAHLGRRFNAHQQTALEFAYPTCAREGCWATARLENDHRDPFALTHVTTTDSADRLCQREHDLKTNHGWSLVEGSGKRPFVPPWDPRHPKNVPRVAPP